jgi:hypothetical protein
LSLFLCTHWHQSNIGMVQNWHWLTQDLPLLFCPTLKVELLNLKNLLGCQYHCIDIAFNWKTPLSFCITITWRITFTWSTDRCVRSFWSLAVIKCQDDKSKKFGWIIWSIKLWGAIISESLTNVTVPGVPLSSHNVAIEWKLSLIYWISFPKSFGPKFILQFFYKTSLQNNLKKKLSSQTNIIFI